MHRRRTILVLLLTAVLGSACSGGGKHGGGTTPGGTDPALAAKPKATDCLSTGFAADVNRSKPDGSKPGPVKVAPRTIAPVGPRVFSWRINASVLLDELEVPLFQDYIVIFNRGTMIRLLFLNPGS